MPSSTRATFWRDSFPARSRSNARSMVRICETLATDGFGNPVSFVGAFPRAAHDALRVPDMRDREQCKHHGSNGEMECCG